VLFCVVGRTGCVGDLINWDEKNNRSGIGIPRTIKFEFDRDMWND